MNKNFLFSIACLICLFTACTQEKEPFWLGADISSAAELSERGYKLYDNNGEECECTELMKRLGLNAIRLRVWVNPRGGRCSKEEVLKMALRAQELDMAIMIDFHYSDWWADPGKQNIPAAWEQYDYEQMKKALAEHTIETLQLLKDNDVEVKWVQVGNETTDGFLWEMGRATTNMSQYAGLTQAGYKAVKQVYPKADVIVHLDGGCDPERYNFIFDGLKKYGAKWDIIGLSVYPYWDMKANLETSYEGTVRDFVANIKALNKKYKCETMVVETGVESKKPEEGKVIMTAIINAAMNETDGHCTGVFYWAPEAEGYYPLGAFNNHRPTIIMDAFTEAANLSK